MKNSEILKVNRSYKVTVSLTKKKVIEAYKLLNPIKIQITARIRIKL